jgi:hypothetical protein
MSKTGWSKREKEIARRAFEAAYFRECMAAREVVRKMAAEIHDPTELWSLSLFARRRRARKRMRGATAAAPSILSSSPG